MKNTMLMLVTLMSANLAHAECTPKVPGIQSLENAIFSAVAAFTVSHPGSALAPVTLGDAVADGYGNCHKLVYFGKDKTPAGNSIDSETNYQAFANGTKLGQLGLKAENFEDFASLVMKALQDGNLPGINSNEIALDAGLIQAIHSYPNYARNGTETYEDLILQRLRELGLDLSSAE